MNMKAYLKAHVRGIRIIKAIVGIMFGLMIVIDIILVMLEPREYPTFSVVIRDHRPGLMWLTFVFGGVVSKVFFNRRVHQDTDRESTGFLGFMLVAAMLFVLGFGMESVSNWDQLVILLCGGGVAYRIWPQYGIDKAMR